MSHNLMIFQYAFGHYIQEYFSKPFDDADDLWTSFQNGISNFVNNNGGNAVVDYPQIQRPQWQQVKDVLDGKLPISTLSSDCE